MNLEITSFTDPFEAEVELLIYAVGYEDRAGHVARKYSDLAKTSVGYYFPNGHILSFEKNDAHRNATGALKLTPNESLQSVLESERPGWSFQNSTIMVDVSSMNRGAMASLFVELLDSDFFKGCRILVVYSIAQFNEPIAEELDFLDFRPLEGFGGWTANPDLPAVLVLGLGYEPDHAVGAVEFLDPSSTFCFFPIGNDNRFEVRVTDANEPLLEIVKESRIVRYPVLSPYQAFWEMRTLIHSLLGVSRIVLVPMGPKIFCSLCMVCQRAFGDELSVWRASGHTLENARDAKADGPIVGYTVTRRQERG
ncbi:hypothetical protein PEL8287_03921 [Roseovarius litorisediminis]|uniref:Uncharacterized protein n=1 Tax=Roseovarius litorisediminis TaxID=1312363 RepID=A0A1Y5TXT5_9RHOB|nr:hypothetical protein [Roseovarius litorisediminis]SLN70581.1 hypothetical protein PEL8287_03921 [Roseovarius litorisediminis]